MTDALRPQALAYIGLDQPISYFEVPVVGLPKDLKEIEELLYVHVRQIVSLAKQAWGCALMGLGQRWRSSDGQAFQGH